MFVSRRGDLPFVRRIVSRSGLESDEEALEAKSETPEPKPE